MTTSATTRSGRAEAGRAEQHAGLGVFVGGRSSRMGGAPKGLLALPGSDTPLVVHALSMGDQGGYAHSWLVGDLAVYDDVAGAQAGGAFRGRLHDAPRQVGPLGGLRALLSAGAERGLTHVAVVACDMPYLTAALLTALRRHATAAPVLAARRAEDAPWEPMLARYRPEAVLPALDATLAAGSRSFQALFARLEVARFEAQGVARALDDWDTPEDVKRG